VGSLPRQPESATSPVSAHPGEIASAAAPTPATGAPAPATGALPGESTSGPEARSSVPVPGGVSMPVNQRPHTHLQAGVRKPKVYTDGTIRYGLSTFTDEPRTIE
jgi:hypothetical protein